MKIYQQKTISYLKNFFYHEKGGVLVITALCLFPLLVLAGIGIDIGRVTLFQTRITSALDAAVIAAARYDVADAQNNAQKFFWANLKVTSMSGIPNPVLTISSDNTVYTLSVSGSIPTTLGGLVGINTLTVKGVSQVKRGLTLEAALVLDVTGSMAWNGKINSLKTAASSFIDILYDGASTSPNAYVSIVPYVATVNIGTNHSAWLSNPSVLNSFPSQVPWAGCVEVRSSPNEESESPPSTEKWPVYYTAPNSSGQDNAYTVNGNGTITVVTPIADGPTGTDRVSIGPNRSCGPSILPLSNVVADLKAKINALNPIYGGGTFANLGAVWGWRTLSPLWSGLWGGSTSPAAYNSRRKVMIIMTDGVSGWNDVANPPTGDPTAYGRLSQGRLNGATTISAARTQINNKFTQVCTSAKAKGIEIYTVLFQVNDATTDSLYQNCASKPEWFFKAGSNSELIASFQQIAQLIKQIRVTL